jgi:hypothetical protein
VLHHSRQETHRFRFVYRLTDTTDLYARRHTVVLKIITGWRNDERTRDASAHGRQKPERDKLIVNDPLTIHDWYVCFTEWAIPASCYGAFQSRLTD